MARANCIGHGVVEVIERGQYLSKIRLAAGGETVVQTCYLGPELPEESFKKPKK